MAFSVFFTLDESIGPLEQDISIVDNDSGQLPINIYGLVFGDIIHQIIFTAKQSVLDSDSALTSIQKIINSTTTTSPSGYFTRVNDGLAQVFVNLSTADLLQLHAQHYFDFTVWIERAGVTSRRTLWVGKTHEILGITTVALIVPSSISITPAAFTLAVSGTQQLAAVALDALGNPIAGYTFIWSSSDNTIATVSPTGLVTKVAGGTATITASTQGVSATSRVAPSPVLTLQFQPLVRAADLARPLVYANYPNSIPQHIGSGLLNTGGGNARAVYPKGGGKWGFVAVTQNQAMQAANNPDVHQVVSATAVAGPWPDTTGWAIVPRSDIPDQYFSINDSNWRYLSTADNADAIIFKRSVAIAIKALGNGDVGKTVRVWLGDQSTIGAYGAWGSAPAALTIAHLDVVLTAAWQYVNIAFPDHTSLAATVNPVLVVTMNPAAPLAASHVIAPFVSRAWYAETPSSSPEGWLNPLPWHSELGLLNQNTSPNVWRNSDHPTLYGPTAARTTSVIAAPDSDDFFGGNTLETFTLNPGDGITSPQGRLEDAGALGLGGTGVPLVPPVGTWFEWYIEPGPTGLPADGELAGYLDAIAPTTILSDDGIAADGPVTTADTGQAWSHVGDWEYSSNRIRNLTPVGGSDMLYVAHTGYSDGTFGAAFHDSFTADAAIIFRRASDGSCLRLLNEGGTLFLQTMDASGSPTSTLASAAVSMVDGDRLEVVLAGSDIQPRKTGVPIAALHVTNATNVSADGFGVAAPGTTVSFTNITLAVSSGVAHTYGPIPLARRPWSKGPTRNQSNGGDFYDGRVQINLASEGYLDFIPRIVVVGSRQLNFNATRAALIQEQPRCEGLRFWVPRKSFGASSYTDSLFEILPDIATNFPSPGELLYIKRHVIFDWSFGSLDNTNGAGNHGYYPALWQSGPYGSADFTFHCDIGRNDPGNGTFYIEILVSRGSPTANPGDYKSWQIRVNGCSQALAAAAWPSGVAFDMVVAAQGWAPVAFGIGLGVGSSIQWLNNGDTFLGGTVVFSSVSTGLNWTFDDGFPGATTGHMGIAADLDRTRQTNGFEQVLCTAGVVDLPNVRAQSEAILVTAGPRKDYR